LRRFEDCATGVGAKYFFQTGSRGGENWTAFVMRALTRGVAVPFKEGEPPVTDFNDGLGGARKDARRKRRTIGGS
jgi:hypothetical protein